MQNENTQNLNFGGGKENDKIDMNFQKKSRYFIYAIFDRQQQNPGWANSKGSLVGGAYTVLSCFAINFGI